MPSVVAMNPASVCEGCDQERHSTKDRIAYRRADLTPLEYPVRYCDDCAAIINAGQHDAYSRVTPPVTQPVTQPVTFPRADGEHRTTAYLALYRNECRPLMRAWVIQTFSPFGEFTLPFGAASLHMTNGEILHDALTIAEHVAIKELRRLLNQNESRLMGEVVRDLMCAAIAKRDMAMDLSQPKTREVI